MRKSIEGDYRTLTQLREHYEIEKELSNKLRSASREERQFLYSSVYNEWHQRVPNNPQLRTRNNPEISAAFVAMQMKLLKRFLNRDVAFLEVGPGDCAMSLEVAKHVKQVFAVDVSDEITKSLATPQNFKLILSNGTSISVPQNSISVAYSNQLMEHIHPDDAREQLQNIYNVLMQGGIYICLTPNRLTGPHDISKYFDTVATGFHLKEYTVSELSEMFQKVGFSKVEVYIGGKGVFIRFPLFLICLLETLLGTLSYTFRRRIASNSLVRALLGIRMVGKK